MSGVFLYGEIDGSGGGKDGGDGHESCDSWWQC